MSNYLINLLQQVQSLDMTGIVSQLIVAAVIGFVIYLSYYLSHTGTVYSRKFNVSLVVLTILTTLVMTAIGNNVALSLGMVGALSIVRFRTAVKDSRDTIYIFWAVVVGLACGVGDYITAGAGSAMVFLVLFVLGRIKNENRMILIVRGARSTDKRIMSVITDYFKRRVDLRVKNTTEDTVELIYEIPRNVYRKASAGTSSVEDLLYEIEHIQYVNIVTQDDDISS
ncbi:DUF4956 domain-containing protein [Diplocloster hominis]|uniref:DUF4956 domain-containing protein n=1 Tax=Diplocloster hominis TaxID=3079010 RepID=UPI0031BB740E